MFCEIFWLLFEVVGCIGCCWIVWLLPAGMYPLFVPGCWEVVFNVFDEDCVGGLWADVRFFLKFTSFYIWLIWWYCFCGDWLFWVWLWLEFCTWFGPCCWLTLLIDWGCWGSWIPWLTELIMFGGVYLVLVIEPCVSDNLASFRLEMALILSL